MTAVILAKGGNVNLTKTIPGLTKFKIGAGWDPRRTPGSEFDLDLSAFLVKADGKVRGSGDFVFYGDQNHRQSPEGSVVYSGDERKGDREGDDETMTVDLSTVPQDIDKIVFVVTIHEGAERRQNFGQVNNARVRLLNGDSNEELFKTDLTEDASTDTAQVFAELYRHSGEWKWKGVGTPIPGGDLAAACAQYGVATA